MPAVPDFLGASYGPLALTGLLRARRNADECVIAWGTATVTRASGPAELLRGIAAGFGPFGYLALAIIPSGGVRRVIVLTDQRLLLLSAGVLGPAPDGYGVRADSALGELRVEAEDQEFLIFGPQTGGRLRLEIKEPTSRDGARLVAALGALAEPGDD